MALAPRSAWGPRVLGVALQCAGTAQAFSVVPRQLAPELGFHDFPFKELDEGLQPMGLSLQQRLRPANSTAGVQHLDFLNDNRFWWLMGSVVMLVGVAVIGLETHRQRPGNECTSGNESTPLASADAAAGSPRQPSEGHGGLQDVARFIFCCVGLNVSMVLWGICQEYVKSNAYSGPEGEEQVPSSILLVLCNRLVAAAFAATLLKSVGKPLVFRGFLSGGLPGLTNLISSWCQYASLDYISFTLQTTTKCVKLLPVIILGSLRGKRYTLLDYAEVLVMVAGLVVFGTETDGLNKPLSATGAGTLLLTGFLFFDSLTPHLQDYVFERFPSMDPLQVTLPMSVFAIVASLGALLVNGGLADSTGFLSRHPVAILHMLVLSLASTVSQYLMVYTVKHFGPMIMTLIVATRQLLSVCLSDFLFRHSMPTLAAVAVVLVMGTILIRTARLVSISPQALRDDAEEGSARSSTSFGLGPYRPLLVCAIGIHVLHGFYALCQEFLASHRFSYHEVFQFPVFVIAVNHTCGAVFALVNLKLHGLPVMVPGIHLTTLPATVDYVATLLQHQALYYIFFPAQTLMKTLKLIPVMLVGRLLKNRTYSWLDYMEAALITGLVTYFVYDFQFLQGSLSGGALHSAALGIIMMVGYIISDSFLSNLEDYVFQRAKLDPAQMLFGLELFSGVTAWTLLLLRGQLMPALRFMIKYKESITYLAMQAWASAVGAYTCTLTVRLYGPAIFTLLMMSRQVLSLVLSCIVFQHVVDWVACLCLVVVAFLILTSSLRRVSLQISQEESLNLKPL